MLCLLHATNFKQVLLLCLLRATNFKQVLKLCLLQLLTLLQLFELLQYLQQSLVLLWCRMCSYHWCSATISGQIRIYYPRLVNDSISYSRIINDCSTVLKTRTLHSA
jgi:hypothetical protein